MHNEPKRIEISVHGKVCIFTLSYNNVPNLTTMKVSLAIKPKQFKRKQNAKHQKRKEHQEEIYTPMLILTLVTYIS